MFWKACLDMKLAVGAFIHPLSWDGGGDRAKRRSEKVILCSPLGVAHSMEVREQHRNDENLRDLTSQKSRRPSLACSTSYFVLKIITAIPTLLKKNSLATQL